jgi:preprotein translocase subunit SecA
VSDLYDPREQWASYLLNAIKAKELFIRDVSYIVRSNEVRCCVGVVRAWF